MTDGSPEAGSPGFEILYEEGPCLGVLKPSGLLTQAPPPIDSLESRIKQFLKVRDHKPGRVYLGVPHRLDRPVSGVMVFAKHVRAARRLAEQFQGRTVDKRYWALVAGCVVEDAGTWADHLRKVPNEPRVEVSSPSAAGARRAVLHFRVLERGKLPLSEQAVSWLEINLETGRMHQIRVQASSRGFAVLGDRQYGSAWDFGPPATDERQRAIALHACRLTFRHPMSRDTVTLEAPPPAPWYEHLTGSQMRSTFSTPCDNPRP